MPGIGDRVIVEGSKVGQQRREGTLIGTVGPLINVRWDDGSVSLFKPAAGAVTFQPAGKTSPDGGRRSSPTSRRAPVRKALKGRTRKPAPKRSPGKSRKR